MTSSPNHLQYTTECHKETTGGTTQQAAQSNETSIVEAVAKRCLGTLDSGGDHVIEAPDKTNYSITRWRKQNFGEEPWIPVEAVICGAKLGQRN